MKGIDPILILLCIMMTFCVVLLILIAIFLTNDGQTFQVVSGLLTAFSGAFLGRIMPDKNHPNSTTVTTSLTQRVTPPEVAE